MKNNAYPLVFLMPNIINSHFQYCQKLSIICLVDEGQHLNPPSTQNKYSKGHKMNVPPTHIHLNEIKVLKIYMDINILL